MWTSSCKAENIESRRLELLEKGFEVLSKKSIESVAMQDVADAVGCGIASLYRYFDKKPGFVVAVATWKWEQFQKENQKRRPSENFEGMTAADIFEFYLDSFLVLYRDHKDLLRFNQIFNVYVQSEHIETRTLQPYQGMIQNLKERFHIIYERAKQDHTIRTDEDEEEMFSKTLHLMLAAVTRYAVGLVYIPENGFDAEKELEYQKNLLLKDYRVDE
ncbi:MAG: TetR/AcrR family transcriptional regulator [Lachnospiraceae bacterium]|nr:TetR/AcrR family transcriptional regulator [Lachnospiraceae bacterium]